MSMTRPRSREPRSRASSADCDGPPQERRRNLRVGREQAWSVLGEGDAAWPGQPSPEPGEFWVHPETENPFGKGLRYSSKNTHKEGK